MAVLVAFSSGVVSDALVRHVERSATRTIRPEVTYDAVIVLGGLVDGEATRLSGEPQLSGAVERLLGGWRLLVEGRARHLVYSCGLLDPRPVDVPESVLATRLLADWGVDPSRLPVDWHGHDGRRASWLPHAKALDESTDALRELFGRLVYRVMGYSKDG